MAGNRDQSATMMPPEGSCSRPDAVRLLILVALASLLPVTPIGWLWAVALLAWAVFFEAVARPVPARLSTALVLCPILVTAPLINPWSFWPMHLLVPLAGWAIVVGTLRRSRSRPDLPLWGSADAVALGLAVLTIIGSSAALVVWHQLAQPDLSDLKAQMPDWSPGLLVVAALGFAVVNAVIEELIWRGVFWQILDRAVGRAWLVIALQAASFGLAHLHGFPRGWFGVAMAAVYGTMLGLIRHRSRGLGLPTITHVFADLTIFAILATLVRG